MCQEVSVPYAKLSLDFLLDGPPFSDVLLAIICPMDCSLQTEMASSCQVLLHWAFTFLQHQPKRLKTPLNSTGMMPGLRVSNRCFHHHAIKTALWWAPSSTVLTFTLKSNSSHHTHTHRVITITLSLYFRPVGSLCCPQGDPSQVPCSVCRSTLCLRRFHVGPCGCWLLCTTGSEDHLGGHLQAEALTQTACGCSGPASTTLLQARQLF